MPSYNGPLVFGGSRATPSAPSSCQHEASQDRSKISRRESIGDISSVKDASKLSNLFEMQSALDMNVMERINDSYVQSLLKMITKKAMKDQKDELGGMQKHLTAVTHDVQQLHMRLQTLESMLSKFHADVDEPVRILRNEVENEKGIRVRSETDLRTSLHELRAELIELGKTLKDPAHEQRLSDARELLAQLRAEHSLHQDTDHQLKALRADIKEEQAQRQGSLAQFALRQDSLQHELSVASEGCESLRKLMEFQIAKLQGRLDDAEGSAPNLAKEISKVKKFVDRRFEEARDEASSEHKEHVEKIHDMVTTELTDQKDKLEQFFAGSRQFEADLMDKVGLEVRRAKEELSASFRAVAQEEQQDAQNALQEDLHHMKCRFENVSGSLQVFEAELSILRSKLPAMCERQEECLSKVEVIAQEIADAEYAARAAAAQVAADVARATAESEVELRQQALLFTKHSDEDAMKVVVRQLGMDMLQIQQRVAAAEQLDVSKELHSLKQCVDSWEQHFRKQQQYWKQVAALAEQ